MLKYTEEHEWLKIEGDVATVGITPYATVQLGDLVFIELPKVGSKLKKGAPAAVVESVKVASDVFAPLDGDVVEVNKHVVSDPTVVTNDPLGGGWLYKIKLANVADIGTLLDAAAYAERTG